MGPCSRLCWLDNKYLCCDSPPPSHSLFLSLSLFLICFSFSITLYLSQPCPHLYLLLSLWVSTVCARVCNVYVYHRGVLKSLCPYVSLGFWLASHSWEECWESVFYFELFTWHQHYISLDGSALTRFSWQKKCENIAQSSRGQFETVKDLWSYLKHGFLKNVKHEFRWNIWTQAYGLNMVIASYCSRFQT